MEGIVIDTNVFVAAGFNPKSASARILEGVREGRFRLIWNEPTRHETEMILRRIPHLDWQTVADLFRPEAVFTAQTDPEAFTAIEDPDDRKFAALSAAAAAPLVTSDKHVLARRVAVGIDVVTPGAFLARERTSCPMRGGIPVSIPKRIAAIDVSHWHSAYDASYLRVLRDLGCDIVGVSDRSERIARDRAERFGSTPFTDYRQMIEATRPEFVIALGRHCDMPDTFRFLVGAGVPFVMEKPWGIDADTVADLARLATAKGAWVSVPFMNRYSFWAVTVKRMIERGEFGKVSHIFFRTIRPTMRRYVEWESPWMAEKSQAGGGALLNLGGHGFDMVRFVTGEEPEVVSAVVSWQVHQGEVENYALATLRTPSGILFHNEVGYTMPTWPANQTDGEKKVAGERLLLREIPEGLQLLGPNREEIIAQPQGWEAGYPRAVKEALEAYGRGDPPPIPASECAHAVRLIFDSYRAAGVS